MASILTLHTPISIIAAAAVGGRSEKEGPLWEKFDYTDLSDRFGKDHWEQSEAESQKIALNLALSKGKLDESSLELLLAGDLINQCTSSSYGLLGFDIPYFGIYGACSTSALGLGAASVLIDGGHFGRIAVVSSSHFCSAERQFRMPIEYGGQRPPSAQWTVTGAGAFILDGKAKADAVIKEVMFGISVNGGINDPNNMGAAMAPAAYNTLKRYFEESGKKPEDFDLILTGDLGNEGKKLLLELLQKDGIDISKQHDDCGLRIYDRKKQDVHSGGSGCGCAATVLACDVLPGFANGRYQDILFMATGALLSADSIKQGLSIPGIAHLIRISKGE